ncbi:hypothetical protein SmJEL517_g05962 [Synchytrium microbalum]|uniref:Intraflagellar transport protein 46 homolog n=1 Tax=Synchytrium microbalum TaxID=1806994 RepID=A0A507BL25_9FUNG|nr:uncharacterized protein SmJEL517_g05962 [Synchytrium microbalum]TPX30477.1 hypothetical protein SmJEL517_g05962 [Synchytrium microbalum]
MTSNNFPFEDDDDERHLDTPPAGMNRLALKIAVKYTFSTDPSLSARSESPQPPWGTSDSEDDYIQRNENFDKQRYIPKARGSISSTLSAELRILLGYISEYKIEDIELDVKLKPFIPEYLPAIGDIDPFIKIPCPDPQMQRNLGLTVLDEPSIKQTDPKVLDLQLRAYSKGTSTTTPQIINSIDGQTLRSNPKILEQYVSGIRALHENKPAQAVTYSKRMPDEEDLMQVWPRSVEKELLQTAIQALITPDLDLDLADYCKTVLALMDIPVYTSQSKNRSKHTIESLHVLFSLYLAFDESQHFRGMQDQSTFDMMV